MEQEKGKWWIARGSDVDRSAGVEGGSDDDRWGEHESDVDRSAGVEGVSDVDRSAEVEGGSDCDRWRGEAMKR